MDVSLIFDKKAENYGFLKNDEWYGGYFFFLYMFELLSTKDVNYLLNAA